VAIRAGEIRQAHFHRGGDLLDRAARGMTFQQRLAVVTDATESDRLC